MSKETLFTGMPEQPGSVLPPETSVSPLARYTLTEMPNDLAAVRAQTMPYAELRSKQHDVLTEHAPAIAANTDPYAAAVTQLDLAFMLGSYLPQKEKTYGEAPPQLHALLEQQATRFDLPARMDYELVIDVNSEEYLRRGHMRTFLAGETALHERDFYFGHYESEPHMKAAAYLLRSTVEHPQRSDTDEVMRAALDNMHNLRQYMAAYARLGKDAMNTFRPYLNTYPDGVRNASGAFMPSVQLAELALHAPSKGHNTYLDECLQYFPRQTRGAIAEWREDSAAGHNVLDLVLSGALRLRPKEGVVALEGLLDEFLRFRTAHLGITRKHIPEAFEDRDAPISRRQLAEFGEPDIMAEGEKGTAGFDIVNVLGGAAYRLVAAKQRLQESYNTRP